MKKISNHIKKLSRKSKIKSEHFDEKKFKDAKIERMKNLTKRHDNLQLYPHPDDNKHDTDSREVIRILRRLHRLNPSKETISDATIYLHLNDFNSAQSIARMGREKFSTLHGHALGYNAKLLHENASHRSLMAFSLYSKYSPVFNPVNLSALPSLSRNLPTLPEWKSLFGSLNQINVEEGNSVLSPAAYLVDLLHLLSQQNLYSVSGEKKNALDILFGRRPDIRNLELTGKNTYTTLPYIDIVNEALEIAASIRQFEIKYSAKIKDELDSGEISQDLKNMFKFPLSDNANVIVKGKGFKWIIKDEDNDRIFEINIAIGNKFIITTFVTYQTRSTDEELAVYPENLDNNVYDKLAQQVYPWSLPFDLLGETARLYLDHLGTPRYKLMELFLSEEEAELASATEYLGLSTLEREIITGKKESKPWQYWGFKLKEAEDEKEGREVEDGFDWYKALRRVPIFLEKSGMDYEQLVDLLNTNFINPLNSIKIEYPKSKSVEESIIQPIYDLDEACISDLDSSTLNKMHRFMRLQQKTGWTIFELDKVIRILQFENIDNNLIITIRHLRELQTDLGISLDELLSWYANIDTFGESSFYNRLFLYKTVFHPVDKNFELNETGDELIISQGPDKNKIIDHKSTISAALNTNGNVIDIILKFDDTKQDLNLGNLSNLYRNLSLSRFLGISIQDFIFFRELSFIDPFNYDNITETRHFIDIFNFVHESGFSFPELDYLLRCNEQSQTDIDPGEEEITKILTGIITGLSEIADNHADSNANGKNEKYSKSEIFIIQSLSNSLNLEFGSVIKLIEKRYSMSDPEKMKALDQFVNLKSIKEKFSSTSIPDHFTLYRILHRLSILIKRFNMQSNQIDMLLPEDRKYLTIESPQIPFRQWLELLYIYRLRDQLGGKLLFEILNNNMNKSPSDEKGEFTHLKDKDFIPENIQEEEGLRHFLELITILKRLDVTAERIHKWTNSKITTDNVRDLIEAVKAKYNYRDWLDVTKSIENRLREKRRESLVSYHMADNEFSNTHDLYQYLLLDVEMSSCMITSRLKLAISSVQLFIQRCLMNLEQYRITSPNQLLEWKHQWEWMKNYRVWEANRKIFLYPENWIEPELRRNKTPFFIDLENDLQQNEMTIKTADKALKNYLERIIEISQLEISGLFLEKETSAPDDQGETTVDILHV
ncbi:MAG: hypothetical protein JSW07_18265, partial [bacterium]